MIEVDADSNLTIKIPINASSPPFTCVKCEKSFRPEQLRQQIQKHLAKRYFRVKLRPRVERGLNNLCSRWYNQFKVSKDICFECGVDAECDFSLDGKHKKLLTSVKLKTHYCQYCGAKI